MAVFGSSLIWRFPGMSLRCCASDFEIIPVAPIIIIIITTILIACLCMTTLTEVFPCFFLRCKAIARVKPAKTKHGPHSS